MKTTIKKTIGILAFLVLSFSVSSAFSKTEVDGQMMKKLNKLISKNISFPDFAKSKATNEFVAVEFIINEEGNIEILDVMSTNEELENYVVSRISLLNVANIKGIKGEKMVYRFRFIKE